jgi:hypothetical protein
MIVAKAGQRKDAEATMRKTNSPSSFANDATLRIAGGFVVVWTVVLFFLDIAF